MSSPNQAETWIQTLRELLDYYLPHLEPTAAVNVGCLVALIAGLFLVFRGMKSDRLVVAGFGLVLGAWLGYQLSTLVGTPGPISAAIGAVAVTLLAWRTYRWWLAVGSVLILFTVATSVQLGRGDLQRYLISTEQIGRPISGDTISELVSREEQERNQHPEWRDQLRKMKDRMLVELRDLGPRGWLLPAAAAIVGGLLAYWALRAFSVVWLGFVGAVIAVLGTATFISAHWPDVRSSLFANPQVPAGAAVGLWLLGLILQAKEARLPKKKPASAPVKDSPKP